MTRLSFACKHLSILAIFPTTTAVQAIVNYFWDFGDGNTSTLFEPVHAYSVAGSYVITLTVTNSCNSSSTFDYHLLIDNAGSIEIVCRNVTCEGMTEVYSSLDGCTVNWGGVIGGTIMANNGSDIEVLWSGVDAEEGFGYVNYQSHYGCPYWTTIKIPVVMQNGIIKGPHNICEGKQGRFTLPQWSATDFQWMIDGNPNHLMLVYTKQRNEIIVNGATPGDYLIEVNYFNTLLMRGECEGTAKFYVSVIENFDIITDKDLTICEGTVKNFSTSIGDPVSWQIKRDHTIVHTSSEADYFLHF